MNFIEFKDTFFDGDEEKAMVRLAYESYNEDYELTGSRKELKSILDSMETKTADRYIDFLKEEMVKNPSKVENIIRIDHLLRKIGMNEAEVVATEKNPFVKRFWLCILTILAGLFVMTLLLLAKRIFDFENHIYNSVVSYGTTIFIGMRSINAASALINMFNFNKAKKYILENSELTDVDDVLENDIENNCCSSEENTKATELTRAYCINELRTCYKDRKNMYLMLAVISVPILFICCLRSILWLPVAIGAPILFFVLYLKNKNRIAGINTLDFRIETLTCVSKSYKNDYDTGRIYDRVIHFSNGKAYKINFSYKGIYLQGMSEEGLYDSIESGDKCYALCFGKENKISLIFPEKEYSIATDEFMVENNNFYPNKDMSGDSILEKAIENNINDLSSISKRAVNEAEKAVDIALKKRNKYLVFTTVVVLTAFLDC